MAKAAERLYTRLEKAGVDVLFDDRQESAGVKFNDADLLGFPVRLVVSPRTLREGMVEVKPRSVAEASMIPVKEAVKEVKRLLADL